QKSATAAICDKTASGFSSTSDRPRLKAFTKSRQRNSRLSPCKSKRARKGGLPSKRARPFVSAIPLTLGSPIFDVPVVFVFVLRHASQIYLNFLLSVKEVLEGSFCSR